MPPTGSCLPLSPQTKAEMMQTWQQIFKENYHKSLDHRSFYFKQAEKKNLTRAWEKRAFAVIVWLNSPSACLPSKQATCHLV